VCGIVGQVRRDGRAPSPEVLGSMCEALEHRGPDSRGVHAGEQAGLGIQRLRIIDLHTGDQPIYNEDRSVVVVLNGEIYNFQELRRGLEARGHRFATRSDTEVIVHLYEEEGPACVRSLHGMFGFALWDERERRLLVARDRLGKKPLYYAQRDGALSFASELNALMRDPEIPRDVDHRALDGFIAYRYVPAPLSAFRAVRKLPPAHTLVWQDGRIELERYWRLDYGAKRRVDSIEQVAEELREHIRRATRRRMIADVPLGAFLSGGTDSSAVVAAMAEASDRPVKTFSIGFESERFNELPRARIVAERFSTDHEEQVVKPDAVAMIPRIVRAYGEPFADSSAIPSFYLAEMTRRHVTVALNGDGGDESFAGYHRYIANSVLGRFDRLPGGARRVAARLASVVPSRGPIDSPLRRVERLGKGIGMDACERFAAYTTEFDGLDRAALYTDEYRALVEPSIVPGVIAEPWRASTADDLVDRMLDVDVSTYLPGDLLTKMDIASMAHSLEARSPLLDHEFMEYAASLPPELKLRGQERKVGLRAAFRGWVPDEILDGRKQGFELPVAEWFRTDLRGYARDVLLDRGTIDRGYFDRGYVEEILDRHASGAEDNSRGIWTLLMFELWHREFVDSAARPAAAAA
jgi:asparagine synthase (glutamine-hydrolysing)